MHKREKVLLSVAIVLLLLLVSKSMIIDTYHPKNETETSFYNKVEDIMVDEYSSWLYDYNLVTTKIVKISKMSERERTVKDSDGNEFIATGVYKAKIRKYIFGFLPFSEERILDIDLD